MSRLEAFFKYPVNISRKILLVDDDEGIAWIMKKIVKEAGHRLMTAATAKEGMGKFKRSRDLDMAIIDLRLGNDSGFTFVKKAKEVNDKVKFVMISAFGDPDIKAKAREIGVRHFLDKPLKAEKLLDIIQRDCI